MANSASTMNIKYVSLIYVSLPSIHIHKFLTFFYIHITKKKYFAHNMQLKLCIHRGTAGFDNSGRGYYFSEIENRPPFDPQSPPNYRPQPSPPNQYPQSNFYEQAHRPLGPNSIYNKPPSSQSHHQYSPHTTPLIPPEFYQGKPAHPPPSSSSSSSSSSSNTQTVSSNTIGVDSGGSSASNNNKNNSNKELDNKDKAR